MIGDLDLRRGAVEVKGPFKLRHFQPHSFVVHGFCATELYVKDAIIIASVFEEVGIDSDLYNSVAGAAAESDEVAAEFGANSAVAWFVKKTKALVAGHGDVLSFNLTRPGGDG
jgi:hypothetical protein